MKGPRLAWGWAMASSARELLIFGANLGFEILLFTTVGSWDFFEAHPRCAAKHSIQDCLAPTFESITL